MNTNKTNSPWPAHRVQFITLCTHEKQTTLGRIYKDKNGFVWQPTVWAAEAEAFISARSDSGLRHHAQSRASARLVQAMQRPRRQMVHIALQTHYGPTHAESTACKRTDLGNILFKSLCAARTHAACTEPKHTGT